MVQRNEIQDIEVFKKKKKSKTKNREIGKMG
jgi:hypothetical protein